MEYRFLLCDDLKQHVDILEKHIDDCLSGKGISYKCCKTTSGAEALEMYKKQKYDIVFLDIDMPGNNGIEVAEKIFKIDNNAVIIYVTAYPQYAERAYEQFVFQYIVKPIDEFKLGIILNKAFEKIEKDLLYSNEKSFFVIKKTNREIKIMNRDVLYFEKILNYINIYTENNKNINVRMTFRELEKIIDMKLYLRCHNGFIVNKSKIKTVSSKEIEIMNSNKHIPVGRGYKKTVLSTLSDLTVK